MEKSCKLTLLDEVNCKFNGLDPNTRRELVNSVKYFQQNARHTPSFKLGRWDGYVSLCNIGGRSYINVLEKLLPIVVKNGYQIELEDLRVPNQIQFEPINKDSYSHIVWPDGHPMANKPIVCYDHQVDTVNGCLANLRCVYVCPTAGGKTLTTAILSDQIGKFGGSLVIVPTKDLVRQTAADYKNMGLDVGMFYGDQKDVDNQHTIATWQSLESVRKANPEMLAQLLAGKVGVIVDEVHKAKGNVLKQTLDSDLADLPIRWGLTGTLPPDELGAATVEAVLGPQVGQIHARDLQEAGILSNLHITVKQIQDTVAGFNDYHSEHSYLVSDPTRLEFMVEEIIKPTLEGQNALIMVDRIPTGKILNELIPDSVFVHGGTDDRDAIYGSVKNADGKVIIATTGVASTGINMNRIFKLYMVELGKAYIKIIQTIGRGLRIAKDKDFVDVYDVCSDLKYSKRHLAARKKHYKAHGYEFSIQKVKMK